jgi:hypothetical protein
MFVWVCAQTAERIPKLAAIAPWQQSAQRVLSFPVEEGPPKNVCGVCGEKDIDLRTTTMMTAEEKAECAAAVPSAVKDHARGRAGGPMPTASQQFYSSSSWHGTQCAQRNGPEIEEGVPAGGRSSSSFH